MTRERGTMRLFVDPGVTTGWCFFNDEEEPFRRGMIRGEAQFSKWLEGPASTISYPGEPKKLHIVVYEIYRVDPGRPGIHWHAEVPTIEVIGRLKHFCDTRNIPYEGQERKYTSNGYSLGGIRKESNHKLSHAPDAEAIGHSWFERKRKTPKLLNLKDLK